MSFETNYQNPQKLVISGRNATNQLVKMAEITVSFDDTSGKDVASIELVSEAGMTVAGFTAPVTITQA